MSIPQQLFETLGPLVGGRVYPDEAPQDAPLPFVVYRLTAQDVLQTIDGKVHATIDTYSLDVWDETRPGVLAIVGEVQTAMIQSAMHPQYQGLVWGADVEMGFEGCSLDYQIVDHGA